jgi:putative ATP-dependent endonuclease of the OLD family
MKLSAIYIRNFRSVKDARIEDIDNFNVLIGKNNSGKSNLLAAIHAFFQILSNGSLVSSQPVIGNLSDFTQRDSSVPISLCARFVLSRDETINILKMMRDERPQIGTALESLPQALSLSVRISILPPPQRYSFVQEIALASLSGEPRNWLLLQIDSASAEEIHRNSRDDQEAQRMRESFTRVLNRFDDDDWRRLRQSTERGEPFMYRALLDAAASPSPDTIASIRRMIEGSQSFAEFQTAAREKIGSLDEERRVIGERRLNVPVKTFSGVEDQIPMYINALIRSIVGIKILYLQEQRRQIGAEEAQKILNLKMRRGGSETLTRIQNVVSELLGARIDAFSSDTRPPRPGERFSAEMDVDDFLVELNGSGIRESLRLILDTTFEDPAILLVEEPEIHLHPGLETAMMRFLKEISHKCQVFITTHSTNFLDSGDYQRIYLVTKDDATLIEALALKEAEEKIPIELGIRLSSLFMYDRLVFVEGPSDELMIREFCNTISVNLSRGNVGFIILRGIGNLSYYAARETLGFLQKRNVEMIFLIDRDERAESEINSIKEALGARIVVWPTHAREIENLLIVPSAIARYISERKSDGTTVNAKDVDEILDRKADELKGYTFLKHLGHHLRPIYPDREMPDLPLGTTECIEHFREIVNAMQKAAGDIQKNLDAIQKQVNEELERRWDKDKRKLVPGAALLDELFKTYGLRFVKLRDGPGLAAKLDVSDINLELQSILRNLDSEERPARPHVG